MIIEIEELDKWWQSLKVTEKERIAKKIKGMEVPYPTCTNVWAELSIETKQSIHDHCTDKHGLFVADWTEGKSMSY